MVLNFHVFLTFIYWVGASYGLYVYASVLKIPMILPFLIMLYLFYLWILGSHSIFLELIVFTRGQTCEGSIVEQIKKNKKYTPQIRFRKSDQYETFAFYREYFDPVDLKQVTVFYYKNWWTCQELAFLEL